MYEPHDLSPFLDDVLLHIRLARIAYTSDDAGVAETFHVAAELQLTRLNLLLDAIPLQTCPDLPQATRATDPSCIWPV